MIANTVSSIAQKLFCPRSTLSSSDARLQKPLRVAAGNASFEGVWSVTGRYHLHKPLKIPSVAIFSQYVLAAGHCALAIP
jgi:hypothetical protein